MIKILRVSSHPSNKRHGVGLHPYKISDTNKFKTVFVSPSLESGDIYLKPIHYDLKVSKVRFTKRPVNASLAKQLIFHISRIYKLIMFSLYCIRQAQQNKVNVIHIHSPMYMLVALWGKLTGKLTCITYHGTDYLRIKDSYLYEVLSKKILEIGCCISPHMIEKMSSKHKEVVYVPNGIDTAIFFDKKGQRKRMILAVGSLKKEKSYDNLIKAFKKTNKQFPDYVLHIAGDGGMKFELEKIIREEGLADIVSLCGNLNKKDLIDKYNEAESFILSSSSEGFPKVVLEAIFCGCKVIATDVGSVSTFLPSKYVIPDNSINKLNEYMIKIINEDIYDIDSDELKSKFTWSKIIQKYEATYKDNFSRS